MLKPEFSPQDAAHDAAPDPRVLHVCGINHERADLAVRERFALNREQIGKSLLTLFSRDISEEALLLSTCNRTELYAFGPDEESFAARLREFFLAIATRPLENNHAVPLYDFSGLEAVRHIFAVTAGLNSMILGENEIKGQVRQAFEASVEAEMAGARLHRLVEAAYRCAKRIKTGTELNAGTLCYGRASVMRAEEALGSIEGKICVVIGAGKVGRTTALALAERNPARLVIINRTIERAREVAEGIRAEAVSFVDMVPSLREADLIIGAAFAPNFLVTRQMFEAVRGAIDPSRRVCLIDAAVPRILDREIGALPGVTRLDLGDLEEIVAANREKRMAAARQAWEIVEEETAKFDARDQQSHLGPLIERIRRKFDAVFAETEGEFPAAPDGPDGDRLRRAQHKLKQRLLHEAISELKNSRLG